MQINKSIKQSLFTLLIICITICSCNKENPSTELPKNTIVGNPIKIGRLEIAQYDFPNTMTWSIATRACIDLGQGWRLPSADETTILFENKAKSGNFTTVNYGYWTSYEYVMTGGAM